MKRKKGFYSISAVAEMFSVHQQTIRLYEKEGLISPKRSEGNTRLFSEEDIERLEEVIYLTHHLGINLAGVEMIMKLQKKIKRLQGEMNKLLDDAQEELQSEELITKRHARESAQRLINIKQEHKKDTPLKKEANPNEASIELSQWEIDYDE